MTSKNLVYFHFEETESFEINTDALNAWLKNTCSNEGKKLDCINVIFCSDTYLHKINLEHLSHDTYTDVVTFDYTENEKISGDLFISVDRVKENAQTLNLPFKTELHRIVIHGTLHLLGYKDKNPEDKALMTEKEDFYLSLQKIS